MKYTEEFDIFTFDFWSGAKDTIAEVRDEEKLTDLQLLIEDYFDGQTPSKTEINDFVWFNRDMILEQLEIDGS